jgi:bacterioferritin (cytochrome b1)
MTDDAMDVEGAVTQLNKALRLQYRSALHYTLVAGSISGLEFIGLSERFSEYAGLELVDARQLVEKIVALGGEPAGDSPAVPVVSGAKNAVEQLIECEEEAIAALHEVIPKTGQEPRSEALEHLAEHLISRKQTQVDQLLRALGEREEKGS